SPGRCATRRPARTAYSCSSSDRRTRVTLPVTRGPRAIIAAIVTGTNASAPQRVLTGFRPTRPLHVGHWAGNVGNAVRLQDEGYECFYFVADWHMLTTHYDRVDELPANVAGLVLDLLAAGIDPGTSAAVRACA